jgi:hypothetical protein
MNHVFWDGVPPSTPRVTTQVFTVPRKGRAFLRLLGPIQGVWLHWVAEIPPKGRSLPCLQHQCPYCPDPRGPHWTGYAPALLCKRDYHAGKTLWLPVVAEITEAVAQTLEGKELRGLVVELERRGDRINGLVECKILEQPEESSKRFAPPPPWFDVRPVLERLWGGRRTPILTAPLAPDSADGAPDVLPFPTPIADDTPPPAMGFALASLVGRLRLGDPLTLERFVRPAQHFPTCGTLLNPWGKRLALFFKLGQSGDCAAGQIGVGSANRRTTTNDAPAPLQQG